MQRTHFGRRRRENSRAQARLASASGTSPTCPHATGLDQELLASTACGGLIIRRSWVRAPPAPPAVLMLGSGPSWTGSWIDVGGTVHGAAIRSTRSGHIEQRLPAVPTLADPGYDGAGTGIHIRSSSPLLARDLDIDTHTWNAMLRRLGLTASNLHWQKQLPATT